MADINGMRDTIAKLKTQRDEARDELQKYKVGTVSKAEFNEMKLAKERAEADLASEIRGMKRHLKEIEEAHADEVARLKDESKVAKLEEALAIAEAAVKDSATEVAQLRSQRDSMLEISKEWERQYKVLAEEGDLKKLRRRLQEAKIEIDKLRADYKIAAETASKVLAVRRHNRDLIAKLQEQRGLLEKAREHMKPGVPPIGMEEVPAEEVEVVTAPPVAAEASASVEIAEESRP